MNLSEELIKAFILAFATITSTMFVGVITTAIITYFDVRSLKKGQNAAFLKIRALERKLFGHESQCEDKKHP